MSKIRVAVIGVGLVGSEFIKQLLFVPGSPFQLVALTSSTRTLFSPDTPITSSWKTQLSNSTEKADVKSLTERLKALVTPTDKVVVVDNTSSDDIASLYPLWLSSGLHVITPNKKAFSGSYSLYEAILNASKSTGARFLNESTVGAGLPIISTLKDLVLTGDKVLKIEGVFSGTMSYIFNQYSTGSPAGPAFSTVVSEAREKGYTVSIESFPRNQNLNIRGGRSLTRQTTSMASTLHASSRFYRVPSRPPLPSTLSRQCRQHP